jgi:hypothetical protein
VKVEVITTYYKEEFLAPLFMMHYHWADSINIITASFPDGKFNDHLKTDLINAAIARSQADWVIVVDFDEFVFPYPYGTDPRMALCEEPYDVIMVPMWRVWRHHTDKDVDRMAPPVPQRLHGVANREHTKPCIFRPKDVSIHVGCHGINLPHYYRYGTPWTAVHWANADPCFGINRSRENRQARICLQQLSENLGVIPEWRQPGFLERCYQQHLNDEMIDIGLALGNSPS